MKILIFIHGADSFSSDETYLAYLESQYVLSSTSPWEDRETLNWKLPIARKWREEWGVVYMPTMPNKQNAKYRDWKIVFEGILGQMGSEDEVTLVGGSLGGCFLLKYFSERSVIATREAIQVSEQIEHGLLRASQWQTDVSSLDMTNIQSPKVEQVHLLAACISEWDFTEPENYDLLQSLWDRVHIWHAEEDSVVPFTVGKQLSQCLPDAQIHFFRAEKWYGHFHGIEKISELEEILFR